MRYKNWWGKPIPSVTEVLDVLAKPGLLRWAWQQGVEGRDYLDVLDERADVGSLVHRRILAFFRGDNINLYAYDLEQVEEAERCFSKFASWLKKHNVVPILLEEALTCETFGGTVDNYCVLDGVKTIIDYKTSKAVYFEHFCQLAGYKMLLDLNGYDVQRVMVLRISPYLNDDYEEVALDVEDDRFEVAERVFRYCLAIYTLREKWKELNDKQ